MNTMAINANCTISEKKGTKEQQAVERVQNEFLNQISQGKNEKEAFISSLKAIDEKYNPQQDCLECSKNICDVKLYQCAKLKSFKMPSKKSILKGLNIIADVVPLIVRMIDILLPQKENKKV